MISMKTCDCDTTLHVCFTEKTQWEILTLYGSRISTSFKLSINTVC